MNGRLVTEVFEVHRIHDFCKEVVRPEGQLCAGSPPYPSLVQIRDLIEMPNFRVGVAEEGDQIMALFIQHRQGPVTWLIARWSDEDFELPVGEWTPAREAIVEAAVPAARETSAIKLPETLTNPKMIEINTWLRQEVANRLADENVEVSL